MPHYVTEEMKKALPSAVFASNPCRIQYCTKEISVFRADILAKFLQGTLHKPAKQDLPKCVSCHYVNTSLINNYFLGNKNDHRSRPFMPPEFERPKRALGFRLLHVALSLTRLGRHRGQI